MMDAVQHPNVVRLVHERVIEGFEFPCSMPGANNEVEVMPAFALVIEWCEYGTLLDLLRRAPLHNHLSPDQVDAIMLSYFRQLLAAVQAMHDAGVCHLDIKPDNVFLSCRAPLLADADPAVPREPRHLIKLADLGKAQRREVRCGRQILLICFILNQIARIKGRRRERDDYFQQHFFFL